MKKHLIASDFQCPYEDPAAVEVFLQIGEDLKPDTLVINGDFGDWRVLTSKYPIRGERTGLISELREEVHRQRELLQRITKRIKPRRRLWNDGNHEWRIFRALSQMPNVLRLLELESVARALSVPEVLGLHGFSYAGEYPHGQWLNGGNGHMDGIGRNDVWIEHGYILRQKSGFLSNALLDKRMCNVVTGHCERLAVTYRNVIGNRAYFAAEGGNLSIIGTPRGSGIYSSVPQNASEYRDSQQGFLIIYEDAGRFYPQAVRIQDGRAVFNGKLYKR